MYKTWADDDIAILRELYKTNSIKDIAKHFNTSETNIRAIASINKIKKRESTKKKKINLINELGFNEFTYG